VQWRQRMPWYIWGIFGICAIFFEVASPTFFAGFIGVGFFGSAVLSYFQPNSLIWQILIALVGMFVGSFIFKRQKMGDTTSSKLGQSDEFIGIRGKVECDLKEGMQGSVMLSSPVLGSTQWKAVSENGVEIPNAATVKIVATHGTYLVVKQII